MRCAVNCCCMGTASRFHVFLPGPSVGSGVLGCLKERFRIERSAPYTLAVNIVIFHFLAHSWKCLVSAIKRCEILVVIMSEFECLHRILGDVNAMGVVPDDCKHGNNGNRNLYHFCYVIIILLDIALPLALLVIAALTVDIPSSTICAKTLFQTPKQPLSLASTDPYRVTYPCCSLGVSLTTFAFSLSLFVIFITIPSVMEPGTMSHSWDQHFCNGYVGSSACNSCCFHWQLTDIVDSGRKTPNTKLLDM